MKKIICILLLFVSYILYGQDDEIVLDTPYEKEISITIPESDEGKINLIKRISELYWAERYDHEKTLEREEKLIYAISDIKEKIVNPLMEQLLKNEKIIEEIAKDKIKTETFSLGVFIEVSAILNGTNIVPGITTMPYIELFETINIGISISYPFALGVGLGMKF
jgi:hypothetical protein